MNKNEPNNPIAALAEAIRTQLSGAIPMPGLTPIEAGHFEPTGEDIASGMTCARHYLDFFLSPAGFHVYLSRSGRVDVTIPAGPYKLYRGQLPNKRRAWAKGFSEEFWRQNAELFATRALTDEDCAAWLEATSKPALRVYENI